MSKTNRRFQTYVNSIFQIYITFAIYTLWFYFSYFYVICLYSWNLVVKLVKVSVRRRKKNVSSVLLPVLVFECSFHRVYWVCLLRARELKFQRSSFTLEGILLPIVTCRAYVGSLRCLLRIRDGSSNVCLGIHRYK